MKTSTLGKLLAFGHQQHTGFLSVSKLCSSLIAVKNKGPLHMDWSLVVNTVAC